MANKKSSSKTQRGVFKGRYTYSEIKAGSKTGESLMAYDKQTAQFVVIKRPSPLQPSPAARQAAIADLEREERALRIPALANHPATCRLLETAEAQGREGAYRYLVLARASGTPVPDLIRQYQERGEPFPASIYLPVMQQLLDLLAVAHRAGVVYNDVKADHLFWDEATRQLKAIDWGNAQFVADKGPVTPAADVFQCGELLYEFVAGAKYTQLSAIEAIDPALQQLITKALQPDPGQRYANAGDMAVELETYCRQQLPEAAEAESPAPDQQTDDLSSLKTALEQFKTRPDQVWPQLETLPVLLRTGVVEQVIACSHHLENAFDCWWAGKFSAAGELFAEALASIEQLPDTLDVTLAAAAWPVREYEAGARLGHEQLRSLLAQVESCRARNEALNTSAIRKQLSDIVQTLPALPGRLPREQSRPGVWLQTFDVLLRLGQEGKPPIEPVGGKPLLEQEAQLKAILPSEPVAAMFHQIVEGRTAEHDARQTAAPVVEARPDSSPRRGEAERDGASLLPSSEATPALLVKRRVRRRGRLRLPAYLPRQSWLIATVVAAMMLTGLTLAGIFSFGLGNYSTGTPAAALSASPTLLLTSPSPLPPSPTSMPAASPTPDEVGALCEKIKNAEQSQEWSAVIEQADKLVERSGTHSTTCGDSSLAQLEAYARFQLGLAAYTSGDFSLATQQWTTAVTLDPTPDPSITVLMRCAAARAETSPAMFETLLQDFGQAQVQTTCGFNPTDYLPAPTAVSSLEVDLLAKMAEGRIVLSVHCDEAPCPSLFQDETRQWHFATFFEETEGALLLDARYQQAATGQEWGQRWRSLSLEIGVASPQPYSFAYGSEFGLELILSDGQTMRVGLMSTAPFSAVAQVVGANKESLVCEVSAPGPYRMMAAQSAFKRYVLRADWEPAGWLQFFVNDQPLCREPIAAPAAPQAGLYFSGGGINFEISKFAVKLASP